MDDDALLAEQWVVLLATTHWRGRTVDAARQHGRRCCAASSSPSPESASGSIPPPSPDSSAAARALAVARDAADLRSALRGSGRGRVQGPADWPAAGPSAAGPTPAWTLRRGPPRALSAPPALCCDRSHPRVQAALRVTAALGVHVVEIDSGDTVYGYDPDEPRVIASNTKLFTTAAILDALGPATAFETRLR